MLIKRDSVGRVLVAKYVSATPAVMSPGKVAEVPLTSWFVANGRFRVGLQKNVSDHSQFYGAPTRRTCRTSCHKNSGHVEIYLMLLTFQWLRVGMSVTTGKQSRFRPRLPSSVSQLFLLSSVLRRLNQPKAAPPMTPKYVLGWGTGEEGVESVLAEMPESTRARFLTGLEGCSFGLKTAGM